MSKRKRARRSQVQTPQPRLERTASAMPSSQRGTFRVAQALRTAAQELPGVVRNRSAERLSRPSKPVLEPVRVDPPAKPQQAPTRRPVASTAKADKPRTVQPGIAKDQLKLKCPPKDSRPKSGGSGRSFVPWNKNC